MTNKNPLNICRHYYWRCVCSTIFAVNPVYIASKAGSSRSKPPPPNATARARRQIALNATDYRSQILCRAFAAKRLYNPYIRRRQLSETSFFQEKLEVITNHNERTNKMDSFRYATHTNLYWSFRRTPANHNSHIKVCFDVASRVNRWRLLLPLNIWCMPQRGDNRLPWFTIRKGL